MNAADAGLPVSKWPWTRWLTFIAIVFAAHVALIVAFGERKPKPPRIPANVPMLKLATESSAELFELNDPTLFALPNHEGFAGPAWLEPPRVEFHRQEWTEPPRWLSLPVGEFGATFNQFMQTNRFVHFELEFKSPPQLTAPVLPVQPAFAENSLLQISGGIANRQWLNPVKLQSWPYADVIAPSRVQVLVDAAGDVVSAVLLPPDNPSEAAMVHDADADQRALELARAARFAPLSPGAASVARNPALRPAPGMLVFNWQTVPLPANTNESIR
jgi:hypothetical protein